jgi:hypothetical protein
MKQHGFSSQKNAEFFFVYGNWSIVDPIKNLSKPKSVVDTSSFQWGGHDQSCHSLFRLNDNTCSRSWAISVNKRSTLSLAFADVSRKYIPCLCENSSPTSVGISRSSRSILLPIGKYIKINYYALHRVLSNIMSGEKTCTFWDNNNNKAKTKRLELDDLAG